MKIQTREISESVVNKLEQQGLEPALARLYAARGIQDISEVTYDLNKLLPASSLTNCLEAGEYLADHVEQGTSMIIVADYDCDGATACAIGLRALNAYGANISFLVPDRLVHGYGLTSTIVDLVAAHPERPSLIITVDNGIASFEGIAHAKSLGIDVLVTDHHLPADQTPDAALIVNPNQRGCQFQSKSLAGCGVIYYVMKAMEDSLLRRGISPFDPDFNVDSLLPIVALGTIADVVGLDYNNRVLVHTGLQMIRTGQCQAGIIALAEVSKVELPKLTTTNIAFGLGPRINAAGRLQSMELGIECLTTDSIDRARTLAGELHQINEERKAVEKKTVEEAADQLVSKLNSKTYTLVLHEQEWHEGVIGIAAGRIKEKMYRPTFVMTTNEAGDLKGSGRSIPGFHLRDALDLVSKKDPTVLLKFGGHAMAAGVTVAKGKLDRFRALFEEVGRELMNADVLEQIVLVDAGLPVSSLSVSAVNLLKAEVWGQGFSEPIFSDDFEVEEFQKMGKENEHSRLTLKKEGYLFNGVKFRHEDTALHKSISAVYKIDVNTFRNQSNVQFLIEHIFANPDSAAVVAKQRAY